LVVSGKDEGPSDEGRARLLTLSDGIFAVAMTLLVLDLHVPDLPAGSTGADLARALLGLGPRYLSYVISFLVIGNYWLGHHRVFRWIVRVDWQFAWLNLLFLLGITVLPFVTGVLGAYGDVREAGVFYAGGLTVVGLLWWLLWLYATARRRLVPPDLDGKVIAYNFWVALLPPVIFLASIGLSFASPLWAKLSWALIGLVRPAVGRIFADRSVGLSAPLPPRTHRVVPGVVRPSRRAHLRRHRAVRRGG
jgi:uncharacterized membrane protein